MSRLYRKGLIMASTHHQQERKGRTRSDRKNPDESRNRQTPSQRQQSGRDGEEGESRHSQPHREEEMPAPREQAEPGYERSPSEEL